MAFTFKPLKIGGGGFLTGIDISPDGLTRMVRADAFGGYIWDTTNSRWQQLVDADRFPANEFGPDTQDGVFELCSAPSNSAIIYLNVCSRMYKSTDRGASFVRLTGFGTHASSGGANGGPPRYANRKMAVDPINPNVCYVSGGGDAGAYVTLDGGTTWNAVPSLSPNGTHPTSFQAHAVIAFDPSGGSTSGKTNNIYIGNYGYGVWRSTNAGASFTQITGGPGSSGTDGSFAQIKIATDGVVYLMAEPYVNNPPGNKLWKLVGGTTWTDITPVAQIWNGIVCDPNNAAKIVASRQGGYLNISNDRGATWGGVSATHTRVATDIPWLATGQTLEEFMGEGDFLFDPVVANKLWFVEGIGVWHTSLPSTSPTSTVWTSETGGIEELVASQVMAPPGSGARPVLLNHDRAIFYSTNADVYPTYQAWDPSLQLPRAFAGDWASNDPTFMVAIVNFGFGVVEDRSAYSSNGGQTWTRMPGFPPYYGNYPGGCIAAASSTNWVWIGGNPDCPNPYYTLNGGTTWNAISFAGIPTTAFNGWSFHYFLNQFSIAADRVNIGTFYIYNFGKASSPESDSWAGILRTTDGGVNWTRMSTGCITGSGGPTAVVRDCYNRKLKSVPVLPGCVSPAGHLFFTCGQVGGGGDNTRDVLGTLKHSTDGGATWTTVVGTSETYDYGFGKPAPGATYPTIYLFGWVDAGAGYVLGLWRGDNFNPATHAATWTYLARYPHQRTDYVIAIDGDKNTYGTVYVGYTGSGYIYGAEDVTPPPLSGMRMVYRR